MPAMFIRHRVRNFAQWKPIFDGHETVRRQYGITSHSLLRDPHDPNLIIIALQVENTARARELATSADLRDTMRLAGVEGPPEIWFGDDVEDKTYK